MENFFLLIFTSLFCSGLLGIFLHFIRKYEVDRKKDFYLWGLLYTVFFLRILVPFDPEFSKPLFVPWLLNKVYYWLCLHQFTIFSCKVSVIKCLSFIILIGAAAKLWKLMKHYICVRRILRYAMPLNEAGREVFFQIQNSFPSFYGRDKVAVYTTPIVKSPISMGIFKKGIYLPMEAFSKAELRNIYLHELYHFKNSDHFFQLMTQIVQCFFWWFPFCKVIVQDFSEFIELRCDACVVGEMDISQKKEYLRTITRLVNKESVFEGTEDVSLEFASLNTGRKTLLERFENVLEYEQEVSERRNYRILITMIVLCGYIASYGFVLHPAYEPKAAEVADHAMGAVEITPENGKLYYDKDGKPFLIIEDRRFELETEMAEIFSESGFSVLPE